MYLEFYGLDRPPFSITPDPQFVYLSEPHREALAHLLYGIRQGGGGGFVQLTGEVGTGKTTLSRLLLSQLPEGTQAALVLNPRLGPEELLLAICEELRLPIAGTGMASGPQAQATQAQASEAQTSTQAPAAAADKASRTQAGHTPEANPDSSPDSSPDTTAGPGARAKPSRRRTAKAAAVTASVAAPRARQPRASARSPARTPARKPPSGKQLFDALGAYLLHAHAAGERVVLIIDEAQNLSTEALEQVRLLTNLETETQKLLQIILIGQPELRDMLARPELRQLAQRITARYHLVPLDAAGTEAYLRHRISSAGGVRFPFAADGVQRLHRRSGGVPRLINIIAERALLGGYAHDLLAIDARTVDRAADEALPPQGLLRPWRSTLTRATLTRSTLMRTGLVLAGLALAGTALWLWRDGGSVGAASTDDRPGTASRPAQGETRSDRPTDAPDAPGSTSAAKYAAPAAKTTAAGKPAPAAGGATAAVARADAGRVPLLDAATMAALAARDPDGGAGPWAELRRRWSAPASLPTAPPDCAAAPAPGWECLRGRIGLDALARIGRPVLLRLEAPPGDGSAPGGSTAAGPGTGWVLLQGLGGERARLWLRGQSFDLDRAALAAVWTGEALALWRTPPGLDTALAGDAAALTAWLRARPVPPDATTLARGLRGFQTAHGLRADGRIGGSTRFALAAYGDGPRLAGLE